MVVLVLHQDLRSDCVASEWDLWWLGDHSYPLLGGKSSMDWMGLDSEAVWLVQQYSFYEMCLGVKVVLTQSGSGGLCLDTASIDLVRLV